MATTYLSLGTNLGNRQQFLFSAIKNIESACGVVQKVSSCYESEPWGFESDHRFLNLIIELKTNLDPMALLAACQTVEKAIGRTPKKNVNIYESRVIDIDIIFYNDYCIETFELIIPHKHFQDRQFVLQPMAEINRSFVDPRSKCSITSLQKNCSDQSILSNVGFLDSYSSD